MSVKIHPAGCRCESCLEYDEAAKDARLASEDAREFGAGRGSDTKGAAARNSRPTSSEAALPSPSGPSEDAREQGASAPCGTCGATPETGISEGCLECEGFAPPALPSLSGPDAETLAATVRLAFRRSGRMGAVLAADAEYALSGLVALVEQRERERDDQRTRRYELAADATRKCTEFRERAEKAEALLARHRQALEDIRDVPSERYLLHYPVAREMHEIALAALAASAPGTEET